MDPSVLMGVMAFQGGAVRVKTDFTDNRARLDEVLLRLIDGDDLDGDGLPDNSETGTAFGQDDAEFNIFNTDRQLSALQTAMSMLRPLPERKTLVYFSSGLRLNGTDNHAQLRATRNARCGRTCRFTRSTRVVWWRRRRWAMHPGRPQAACRCSPGRARSASPTTSSARRIPVRAVQGHPRQCDVRLQRSFAWDRAAAESLTSYYIIGYYSTHTTADGPLPARARVADQWNDG